MLPRRGWVGWIEENSKVLGAISVWIFILCGGIGALVASASGNNAPPAATRRRDKGGVTMARAMKRSGVSCANGKASHLS